MTRSDAEDLTTAAAEIVLSAVPVLGAPIASGIAAWESRRLSKRVMELVGQVAALAEHVDHSKLDKDYLNSDEYQDVVMAALEAGRRTANADKRRIIAAILLGAASSERPDALDIEALLTSIGDLSSEDLRLARFLYDEGGGDKPMAIVTNVVGPADFPDREFHLKRLEATGLIREQSGTWDGQGEYQLTMTFHRLMALLKLTGS